MVKNTQLEPPTFPCNSVPSVVKKQRSPAPRVDVLGVGISVLNLDSAIEHITAACSDPQHLGYVTITGVHGVMESQGDNELKEIHNNSFLSTPDGMPMVWLGKYVHGHEGMDRVYGPELMDEIFSRTEGSGIRHFFYGGGDGVAEELKDCLQRRYPDSDIVGTYTPPFRPLDEKEEQALVHQFNDTKPHLIWIGLSTPKQERFMHDLLTKYPDLNKTWNNGTTLLGVGAAFDFLSYQVKQAPFWIQRSGFEWLFRVFQEPKRLLKRYAVTNVRFINSLIQFFIKERSGH